MFARVRLGTKKKGTPGTGLRSEAVLLLHTQISLPVSKRSKAIHGIESLSNASPAEKVDITSLKLVQRG